MNDDDNKPFVPEGGVDESKPTTEADETKIEVKVSNGAGETEKKDQTDEIDITAALNGEDVVVEEEPEEPVSDFDRELDRVEGIESAATTLVSETSVVDEPMKADEVDDVDMTAPVNLDEKIETEEKKAEVAAAVSKPKEEATNAAFVSALQQQEQKKKTKKGAAGVISVLLAILVLAAGAGAAFFYLQWSDTRDQLSSVEGDLDTERAKVVKLQSEDLGESKTAVGVSNDEEYVEIKEFGIRYKKTAENESLIHAYLGVQNDIGIPGGVQGIGFSTIALADTHDGEGADYRQGCLPGDGSVGAIVRFAPSATPPAEMGELKKLGDRYYMFSPPQAVCTQAVSGKQVETVTAQIKAVFDALELIPAEDATDQATSGDDTATSSTTQTPAAAAMN